MDGHPIWQLDVDWSTFLRVLDRAAILWQWGCIEDPAVQSVSPVLQVARFEVV